MSSSEIGEDGSLPVHITNGHEIAYAHVHEKQPSQCRLVLRSVALLTGQPPIQLLTYNPTRRRAWLQFLWLNNAGDVWISHSKNGIDACYKIPFSQAPVDAPGTLWSSTSANMLYSHMDILGSTEMWGVSTTDAGGPSMLNIFEEYEL